MKYDKSPGISLEFKDLDTSKRTAVIKHAVYNSIDRVKDVSTKGMFNKSWQESKPDFLFNHVPGDIPGPVTKTYDDKDGAYTEVKFGAWTLGNDVLEMADAGVLKGASYGYVTEKKEFVNIKGQKVRKLTEVKHVETSLLTLIPAHPEAGIVTLNKAFDSLEIKALSQPEQDFLKSLLVNDLMNLQSLIEMAATLDTNSDLYGWVMWNVSRRADLSGGIMDQLRWNQLQLGQMKAYVDKAEKFCRNAKASDETIIQLENDLTDYKQILSQYDTLYTQVTTEPDSSVIRDTISSFIQSLN